MYLFCRFRRSSWVKFQRFTLGLRHLFKLLVKVSVAPSPMKLQKNWWNKFVSFDSLYYTVKERNIKASTSPVKLSAFISLRDACNEHHIFLPWLFVIPQRNLTKADFDHVLGNHFWTVSQASHNQQNNTLTFVKLYFMETAFIAWTEWNWSPFNKLWL